MLTIPIDAKLTDCYLEVLYRAQPFSLWTKTLRNSRTNILWHDGETAFLFPGGLNFAGMLFERERKKGIRRLHLSEIIDDYRKMAEIPSRRQWLKHFPAYPSHHWLGDFKLMWMFRVLNSLEERIGKQSLLVKKLWLMGMDSDIFSSVRKPPHVKVHKDVFKVKKDDIAWEGVLENRKKSMITILRAEKHFEGEQCLDLTERLLNKDITEQEFIELVKHSKNAYFRKIYSRVVL